MKPNLATTCAIGNSISPADEDRIAQILDDYLRRLENGESADPDALVAGHPELAERLRGYLSGLALVKQAVADGAAESLSVARGDHGLELRGQLGDFRLVREIGRGGMGIVYEAVQISLGRRVALKVLPFTSAIDEKQITRFKNEAQSAAQVDHPHIVPVFAIGQDHGIHYFAMQLIGGKSLGQLLDELRLADAEAEMAGCNSKDSLRANNAQEHIRGIARLGVQAAEALHAVHEIGVVHRDVKPSNLLLDPQGKLWVTDFGLARCQSAASPTETGQVLGTKRYMSPEQALGQAALVDHRTDVYSLGVTLYELATLRHPYEDLAGAEIPFERGRTAWRRPRYWNHAVPEDFENIVLKAMAEGREERYATARDLAEDLRRFLAGEPILARRPTLSARLGKWTRRHKRSVTAAVGVMAVIMTGLVASLVVISGERSEKAAAYRVASANHLRAERNYQQAQAKYRQAREMLDRLGTRAAQRLREVPGAEGVRRELLAEMLPYYQDFARESANDPALITELALTFSNAGYLAEELGLGPDAEQAYRDAQRIFEQLSKDDPKNPRHSRSLALCSNHLAQVLQKRGESEKAREQFEQALAIQYKLMLAAPTSKEYRTDLAATENNYGLLLSQAGDKLQAADRFRRAIRIQEKVRSDLPEDESVLNALAASYNNLSSLYGTSDLPMAQRWVEQAMSLQLKLVLEHPRKLKYQSDLALSYNNLGALFSKQERRDDAEACFQDAIAIQRRLIEVAPLITTYRRDLAVSFNNLGMAQAEAGELANAEKSFNESLAIQTELVQKHPQDLSLLSGLGGVHNNLGMARKRAGNLSAASTAFEQAIAAQQQAHDKAPEVAYFRESLSKHYFNQAEVLRALGRPADAVRVALQRRDLWPHDATRLVNCARELAATCKELNAGDLRQKYLAETTATLQMAKHAGLDKLPNLNVHPFDVLADESTIALSKPNSAASECDATDSSEIQ